MSMSYSTGGGSGDFKNVPAGTYVAVCNLLADLGLQPGSELYPKPKCKVAIRFEVPDERIDYEVDGQKREGPMTLTKTFTASMNAKSSLRRFLEAWRGCAFTDAEAEAFDIHTLLGVPAMLTVVEYRNKKGEMRTAIGGASRLMKGMRAPKAENPLLYYMPGDDVSQLTKLPKWIQDAIANQVKPEPPETDTSPAPQPEVPFVDDDIPFN